MPDTRPDLTGVDCAAFVVTVCPLLAAHVTALQPGLRTALLTCLAGIGTLRDRDGLLLLTHRRDPAGDHGPATTAVYLGTDLDDADVWARAVKLRARDVVLPDRDAQLVALLAAHLGATA